MTNSMRGVQREILNAWPVSRSIGGWSFYFLAKAILAITGVIELNLLFNIALLSVLIAPIRSGVWYFLSRALVFICAIALLYHESYLPPFSALISQWDLVSNFTLAYQVELLFRFVDIKLIAAGLVFAIVFWYVRQMFNLTTLSIVALIMAHWWSSPAVISFEDEYKITDRANNVGADTNTPNTPDEFLLEFYANERQNRRTQIVSGPERPVDIIVLNICSMSWQDLELSGQLAHPLIQQGSIHLTNFYAGSSYSGPSTLRLLRGHCGHEPHDELFTNSNDCSLGQVFTEQHWQQEILMNHQGDFDNYLDLIRTSGGMSQASFQDPSVAPQTMRGFDQMPIYSDAYLLEQWSNSRPDERSTFTLYNTISLHDGNQLPGFRGNSMASYTLRAEQLLTDLQLFMDKVILGNRATIVVIAPEHGAGLRGDRFQIPGMREIPTPVLTHVPVIFHFLNMETTDSITVDAITGPAAVAHVLTEAASVMGEAPNVPLNLEKITRGVRTLPRIGENDQAIMLEFNEQVLIRTRTGGWTRLAR